MGMAASQARYLGLQARKTNTEYEGQQVNQQRTALANQSADLFRRLLTLNVPTPPDQTNYKKDSYTYNDPTSVDGKAYIDSMTKNEGSDPPTYTVVVRKKVNEPQYNGLSNQNVSVIKDADEKYSINLPNGTQYTLDGPISPLSETLCDEFNKLGASEYENQTTDTYYKFTNGATGATTYINTKSGFDPDNENLQNVDFFMTMTIEKEAYETIENAVLSQSEDGVYTSLYYSDNSGKHTFELSPSSDYDEAAYDAAMNQYNYDKALYEKEVADINAKTEELQEEDRTLELRLKQLDTEQEALQTELDSVKKVIDKNIENVFKTFQ